MKSVTRLFAAALLFLNSGWVLADEECEKTPAYYASLYYLVQVNRDEDTGKIFKDKVANVEKLGKNKAFSVFNIASQDISIEQDSYVGGNNLTLAISFGIQYDGDYNAVTVLQKESGARSVSVSKSACTGCGC